MGAQELRWSNHMSQQVVDNKKADADNKGDPGVGLGVGTM